jgi:hypothetical protein
MQNGRTIKKMRVDESKSAKFPDPLTIDAPRLKTTYA